MSSISAVKCIALTRNKQLRQNWHIETISYTQRVQCRKVLVDSVFVFFKLLFFGFVVDICELVQDVEAILHLPLPQFAVSQVSLLFQKRFPGDINS